MISLIPGGFRRVQEERMRLINGTVWRFEHRHTERAGRGVCTIEAWKQWSLSTGQTGWARKHKISRHWGYQ
jgi:predicted double-glycine peptidase